ncbi:MAG: hypothetical protein HY744_33790 [Deltaproteobacteria bacterium]|nr:hypothetical protein [Deltaproteobacteria bacterium]
MTALPSRPLALLLAGLLPSLGAACGAPTAEDRGTDGAGGPGAGAQGGGAGTTTGASGGAAGASGAGGQGGAGGTSCHAAPQPADGPRKVIVSHPYDAGGKPAGVLELLELSASGKLSQTGVLFEMGRSTLGEIAFTPDGQIGLLAQEDGSLGVFRVDGASVEVVHAAFSGSFYAEAVTMGPDGGVAYVIDPNWPENGGGLYRVRIGCDGTLVDDGLVVAAKNPAALRWLGALAGRALLAGRDVLGSPAGTEAHLLELGPEPVLVGSAEAFGDDEAILSALALTANRQHALLGDNNAFSGLPNRVAVLAVQPASLEPRQVLSPIEDPIAILCSPFDDAALVVSGFGDAVIELGYDPAHQSTSFALVGEPAYQGGAPQLPGAAVLIDRGQLRGLVLVAELSGVRRLVFEPGTGIKDLGLFDLGEGLENVVGVIGVQP